MTADPVLTVEQLSLSLSGSGQVLHQVSFQLTQGQTLLLVGESGSGKSVTALSVLRLLPPTISHYHSGRIVVDGCDTLGCSLPQLRALRGGTVGMVFQEPLSALNPLHRVGRQLIEPLAVHRLAPRGALYRQGLQWLERVGLSDPRDKWQRYPHQLSGGERQRLMIAMALITRPKLLILDEPTTAIDAPLQHQLLQLLAELQREMGMAMLFITHDLRLAAKLSGHMLVMQQGRVVEQGRSQQLLTRPQHAYTQLLTGSDDWGGPVPRPHEKQEVLLSARQLAVHYGSRSRLLAPPPTTVLRPLDLRIHRGESVALVGESGAGKSSAALAMLRLLNRRDFSGRLKYCDADFTNSSRRQLLPLRRKLQIVFQDPFSSLNPRMSVAEIIAEGLAVHQKMGAVELDRRVCQVLAEVGLNPADRYRYPNEFSGGQRQRVAVSRALLLGPELLVLDEPTSSLDRATQQQLVTLLKTLQRNRGLSYLFISHDLKLVRSLCHYVLVLRNGLVVEQGPSEQLFQAAQHPYTRQLLSHFAP